MEIEDGGRHAVRQGIGVERSRHARGQRRLQEELNKGQRDEGPARDGRGLMTAGEGPAAAQHGAAGGEGEAQVGLLWAARALRIASSSQPMADGFHGMQSVGKSNAWAGGRCRSACTDHSGAPLCQVRVMRGTEVEIVQAGEYYIWLFESATMERARKVLVLSLGCGGLVAMGHRLDMCRRCKRPGGWCRIVVDVNCSCEQERRGSPGP